MHNKIKDFVLLAILILAGAIICFIQGQDATWDLANYHYYGVWAFLNNRICFDIMPGWIILHILLFELLSEQYICRRILLLFQNPKAKWIYLYGEMWDFNFKYPQSEENRIKNIINSHKGKTYLIYSEFEPAIVPWEYIEKFIKKDEFDCKPIEQKDFNAKYYFCSPKDKTSFLNTSSGSKLKGSIYA